MKHQNIGALGVRVYMLHATLFNLKIKAHLCTQHCAKESAADLIACLSDHHR